MEFFDTHSHMYLTDFDHDREECMERAREVGVTRVALPNIDTSSIAPLKAMQASYPHSVIAMMGLHPCSVNAQWEEQLADIEQELDQGTYHAIGEIGMDLYWDRTYHKEQEKAFKTQIQWAKSRDLPIVIHARDSFQEICEVLDELADHRLRGVFHCFTGSIDDAHRALGYSNFYLGIGGVLTFKNGGLDKVLPEIGIDRVVLETDAPYLAPTPFRGKRNETAYTRLVAEKLAEICALDLAEVARTTTSNALQLFSLHGS